MSPPTTNPFQLLHRTLRCLESSLRSINLTVGLLTSGPDLDACLIQHLQEQVGRLREELSDVSCDILLMEQEEQSLLEQESDLDKAFFDLSL